MRLERKNRQYGIIDGRMTNEENDLIALFRFSSMYFVYISFPYGVCPLQF